MSEIIPSSRQIGETFSIPITNKGTKIGDIHVTFLGNNRSCAGDRVMVKDNGDSILIDHQGITLLKSITNPYVLVAIIDQIDNWLATV